MKRKLKKYVWIEGFDHRISDIGETNIPLEDVIYNGATSDISEEMAKKCVERHEWWYLEYSSTMWNVNVTAKESIKSACSQEFCIIYKTK